MYFQQRSVMILVNIAKDFKTLNNVINDPFYATQIINPFLNSRISANHEKVFRLSAMVKSL